jgi:hypothetical protein
MGTLRGKALNSCWPVMTATVLSHRIRVYSETVHASKSLSEPLRKTIERSLHGKIAMDRTK